MGLVVNQYYGAKIRIKLALGTIGIDPTQCQGQDWDPTYMPYTPPAYPMPAYLSLRVRIGRIMIGVGARVIIMARGSNTVGGRGGEPASESPRLNGLSTPLFKPLHPATTLGSTGEDGNSMICCGTSIPDDF